MPVADPKLRELAQRLEQLESELDALAVDAWKRGLHLRISTPSGDVVPQYHHSGIPKQMPALRLVRPHPDGPASL